MKLPNNHFKAALSLAIAISLVIAISLSSFAASSSADEPSTDNALVGFQEPTGTLTAKAPVTVNGAEAKTGETIMNGSVIHAGTGGHASIELGPLGRVAIEEVTTITLTMSDTLVQTTLNRCGAVILTVPAGMKGLVKILHMQDVGVFSERKEVDVKVYSGQVTVKRRNQEETLNAGDREEFDDALEVSATGEAVFKVFCHEDHVPFAFFLPLSGLLFLTEIGEDTIPSIPPVLSPVTP